MDIKEKIAKLIRDYTNQQLRLMYNGYVPSVPLTSEGQALKIHEAYLAAGYRLFDKELELIKDLVDEGDCYFDHHGYCQAHGWTGEGECPHSRAKAILTHTKKQIEGEG